MKKGLIALILPLSAILLAETNLSKEVTSDKNMTTKSDEIIVSGTTEGHYQKPGAPVDMRYTTKKVRVGEVSDVNITLITPVKSGEMDISIDFDEELKPVGEIFNKVVFPINPEQRKYNLHLKVTASDEGLFYVRLLVKVKEPNRNSANMRAFAVPVYVGNGRLKSKSKQKIMRALSGENLSVSKAKETIKPLSE
jgi:hypothetical protein